MIKQIAAIGLALGMTGGYANAAPLVQVLSITLDKPAYNSTYSLGVEAFVQVGDAAVTDVKATHQSISSGSAGTWPLEDTGGRYWAWGPQIAQNLGPLDGSIVVVALDSNGEQSSLSVALQPAQEMDWPTATVAWTGRGFSVTGTAVTNADDYDLWLWDPIDRYYPSIQEVTDPSNLKEISAVNLVVGRQYNLYWIANNYIDASPNGIVYRSNTLQYLVVPAGSNSESSNVPVPTTLALLALGLVGLGVARRKQA
jgi:hypothetical protein